jgi:hypothetical protein
MDSIDVVKKFVRCRIDRPLVGADVVKKQSAVAINRMATGKTRKDL